MYAKNQDSSIARHRSVYKPSAADTMKEVLNRDVNLRSVLRALLPSKKAEVQDLFLLEDAKFCVSVLCALASMLSLYFAFNGSWIQCGVCAVGAIVAAMLRASFEERAQRAYAAALGLKHE